MVSVVSIIECPWCCVEEHDGYQAVQHHGEHQGDQVEQGDVREEHCDVHLGSSRMSEVTFWDLNPFNDERLKITETDHSKSLYTAVLDMCEDQPGGAVEQGEHPAGEDDPLCPGHGTDVLKLNKN